MHLIHTTERIYLEAGPEEKKIYLALTRERAPHGTGWRHLMKNVMGVENTSSSTTELVFLKFLWLKHQKKMSIDFSK